MVIHAAYGSSVSCVTVRSILDTTLHQNLPTDIAWYGRPRQRPMNTGRDIASTALIALATWGQTESRLEMVDKTAVRSCSFDFLTQEYEQRSKVFHHTSHGIA